MKEFSQSAITPPIYSLHCDWINSHHHPGFTSLSVSHWGEKFSQIDATALLWYVTSLTQEQEKLLMWRLELMASLSSRISELCKCPHLIFHVFATIYCMRVQRMSSCFGEAIIERRLTQLVAEVKKAMSHQQLANINTIPIIVQKIQKAHKHPLL